MPSYVLVVHHMVPKEAFTGDIKDFLQQYFPGFGIEAEYNFSERRRHKPLANG